MQNAPADAAVKVKHSRGAQNWLVLLMWPAQFCRKLVLGTRRKRPRPRRDWDVCLPRPRRWQFFSRRDRDKTLVHLQTVSRPRRQDQDHNPAISYKAVAELHPLVRFGSSLHLLDWARVICW